jgi:RNA polymerase subunit RPABC4/transcription elongation factor Spt4
MMFFGMVGVAILSALLIGLIPAYIAKDKGRNFLLWWLYGTLLFIVAMLHALLMKADSKTQEAKALADGGRKCPHCAEVVKAEAKVCRFCQRDLPPETVAAVLIGDMADQQTIEQYRIVEKDKRYVITHYDDFIDMNRNEEFGSLQSALDYARKKPAPH